MNAMTPTVAFTCSGLALALALIPITSPRWDPCIHRGGVWLRWRWQLLTGRLRHRKDEAERGLRRQNLVHEPGHRRRRGRRCVGKRAGARGGPRGERQGDGREQ